MKQAFVLYANDSYADTVEACVHSLITHSCTPVIVYMLNSDRQIKNALSIRWDCDVTEIKQNKFIDRSDINVYKLLIQRPLIVKDAINKFAYTVAYIDSDSVATKYVNNIFNMFDNDSPYPYFVEGIYDYLHVGDRGGADSRDDLSTTLEHPACELFGVDQYVRERYRQTGYFVANKNCIDFLDEWYQMCTHPEVMANNNYYAAYNEETIANVLLWKYNMQKGLPYIYMNADPSLVKLINHNNIFTGQDYMIGDWGRVPASKDKLLFYHGEKRKEEMLKMIRPNKVLYLVPHLSTGGMPAFVLKTIEVMQEYINICVVEYNCYSLDYVVQRNKIKDLVENKFYTLFEDKTELFNIIKDFNPDIIHIHEPSERFDADVMSELYRPNRLYKIIETCHDVSFDPQTKLYHPDAYAFCTPYHYDTFAHLPSYKQVIEYPIDPKKSKKLPGINNVVNVGLWTPGKNQAEGIEIARANPNFNFNFVGNQAGNFKDYWEPLMADLPSNVKVWGERDDVEEFLKHANIFMFNSTWECNPLVLREAISYGLPIVAHYLPQYGSMFERYIQPIDTDLNTIKCNYIVPTDNTSDIFAQKYNEFYNKVLMMPHEDQNVHIHKYFVEQPFLEIKSPVNSEFKVQYFDENNVCQYENTIGSNSWVRLNRE